MRKLVQSVILVTVVLACGMNAYAQSCTPTANPTIFYPATGALNIPKEASGSVTLKWTHNPPGSTGTTAYDVYFGPLGSGCTNSPRATVSPTTKQWSPPANEIVSGSSYEWKVVAKGPIGCPVKPSVCSTFKMLACPASAPVLTTPANNSIVPPGNVTVKWNAVANTSYYEVFAAIDGNQPALIGTSTTTEKVFNVEPGRSVQWAVRAVTPGCTGFLSQSFFFTTSCPTAPSRLVTPSSGSVFKDDTTIVFTWDAVFGSSGYGFYRSLDGGQTWTLLADNLTGRTYSAKFPVGNWLWRVRAKFNGDCQPLDSAASGFTVVSATCNNAAPVLVTPPDGSSQTLPFTISWTAPAAGKKFLIFVSGPNGTSKIGETTANSFVVTSLAPGTYQLYVVGQFDNCPDVESARRTVTVKPRECPSATINTTSPLNNATVTSPVTLSWTGIANATTYRIWASHNGGPIVLIASTTALSVPVNLPAGSFKWKVEGVREDCPSILSNEGSFTIPTGTNCSGNTAPQLQPPIITDGGNEGRKSVVLPWIAQTRGALYRVFLSLNGKAFEDVGATRTEQFQTELPAGSYRWFVQEYVENCTPFSSQIGDFVIEATTPRCPTDKPVLEEPANHATVTQLRFRVVEIETQNRNVRYRFFAVVDRTNLQPEIVFLGSSTKPEFEPELQLPPGTYQVFAEKTVDECPSTFSDRVTITIARAQNCPMQPPLLQSPANGATNLPPVIDFIWVPQGSPAAKYVLIAQVNDGAPTPIGSTTETHLTRRVPPGRLRWRVAAFTPGCDPLFSKENIAGVTLPQECSTVTPLVLQPANGARVPAGDVTFEWTAMPQPGQFQLFVGKEGETPILAATTTATRATVALNDAGEMQFYVVFTPTASNCPPSDSAVSQFKLIAKPPCDTPDKPTIHVVGRALSGVPYTVRWSKLPNVKVYQLEQSTSPLFDGVQYTITVTDTQHTTSQTVLSGAVQYHYRVRGLSDCDDSIGRNSETASITVVAQRTNNSSSEISNTEDVVQQFFIPGDPTPSMFSISIDKPWIKATPSSGPLPPEGTTVMLTSDRDQLRIGGNTATIKVTKETQSSGNVKSNATTVIPFPINVSLVTPVTPSGKSGPPPDALIFSGVGHAAGQNNSFFESDVRLVNLSAQTMKYQINYTPSGTDGTMTGNTTTVEIPANQTLALDDVVSTIFGLGEISGALGVLEARPLTSSSSSSSLFSTITSTAQQLLTIGSSRTYNLTSNGTFGQFVPATPFAKFLGSGKVLSLLHVAQSEAMRANLGFLEASGNPVDLVARVYDVAGQLLATIPVSLGAMEHKQIGLMLATNGITDLQDGRVEVEVIGGTGKITAYVSEVDNMTNDPFLVSAVEKGSVNTNRYVIPGMAHKDLGFAFWVSDLRVHNAGTTQVPATLTFYTEANPSSFVTRQVMIEPGEIEVLNDLVQNLFGLPNGAGGSVVITTPTNAPLGVTARTYNKTTNGTYGQYLPAVTVAESVGLGERALHILQVEQSSRLRTNVALTETSGNPVQVEVSLVLPDSLVTPTVTYDLAGNEFRQFSVGDFQQPDAIYNARITVRVIGGTGKVTTHGSLIDMQTNDGTLIPPQ